MSVIGVRTFTGSTRIDVSKLCKLLIERGQEILIAPVLRFITGRVSRGQIFR